MERIEGPGQIGLIAPETTSIRQRIQGGIKTIDIAASVNEIIRRGIEKGETSEVRHLCARGTHRPQL